MMPKHLFLGLLLLAGALAEAAGQVPRLSAAFSARSQPWSEGAALAAAPSSEALAQKGDSVLGLPEPTVPAFVHPGVLHTTADLQRMRDMLAEQREPWPGGFGKLKAHRQSQANWRSQGPFADVVRDPQASRHIAEFDADANAAYQNALMWCLTTNQAHARKAIEILNAWSGRLRTITGHDKELGASLGGFKFVNAAELLRHPGSGWQPQDIAQFARMLRDVLYPVIKDFATFANGNWDTGCLKTMLAVGVFLDDRTMFDRAVDYYRRGSGTGCLTNYIINAAGQCQESGRDQQHTQLGLGHLAEAAEIAWHQGVDLYGEAGNRLLAGFEYTAKYNLGLEVPFSPHTDRTGKYKVRAIASEGRGRLRPIYEMVWNHYERRRGVPAPFTRQAAERIRPEGTTGNADHPGFGTLLFSQPEGAGAVPQAK
jgi:hypothetical protein